MKIFPIHPDIEKYLKKKNLKKNLKNKRNFLKKILFIQVCKQNFLNQNK